MQMKIVWRAGLPIMACAVAFCATEVWNTKVSSHWTEAEANLILNNSPWAKQVKTKSASSGVMRRGGGVRLLANEGNRGKGFSVRRGMLEAKCDWVLFTDVDHATPIEHLTGFAPHAAMNDILIGSRRLNS